MEFDKEKIIFKNDTFGGIDLGIIDYSYAFSQRVARTIVTEVPYKKFGKAYITLKDNLDVSDAIRTESSTVIYKIQKLIKLTPKGRLYRISRVDCNPFVSTDFNNLVLGAKILIKTRGINNGLFSRQKEW